MDAKGPGLLFIVGRGALVASRGHGGGSGGRVVVVASVTAMSDGEINIIIIIIIPAARITFLCSEM